MSSAWSIEGVQYLGGPDSKHLFNGIAPLLDSSAVCSVRQAIDGLNKGLIHCEADSCVVYSASSQAYYLLFRDGKAEPALKAVSVSSERARALTAEEKAFADSPKRGFVEAEGFNGLRNPCVVFVGDEQPRTFCFANSPKNSFCSLTAAEENASEPRMGYRDTTVVYFPGDIQDCSAEDMQADGHGKYDRYNLQLTAKVIAAKHNASRCLCVRARDLVDGTYAGYSAFCPGWNKVDGRVLGFDGVRGHATEHLAALLDSAFGADWEDGDLEIVAFSRGSVVLHQLVTELACSKVEVPDSTGRIDTIHRVWSCVRALHNVDGGNEGPSYPQPGDAVRAVRFWTSLAQEKDAEAKLLWYVHFTPYTMQPSICPSKHAEQTVFVNTLKQASAEIFHVKCYHKDSLSIESHWRCLEEYHVSPSATDVEYYSGRYVDWLPTQITATNADGAIMVACKAGAWIGKDRQAEKIRYPVGKAPGRKLSDGRHLWQKDAEELAGYTAEAPKKEAPKVHKEAPQAQSKPNTYSVGAAVLVLRSGGAWSAGVISQIQDAMMTITLEDGGGIKQIPLAAVPDNVKLQ